MVEETKNEETLEGKEKPASPSEEETKKEVPEPEKEELPEQNIDYKKLLEEEKKKRKDDRKKFFTKKDDDEGEPEISPEEIKEEINERVKENIAVFKREILQSNAENWAEQLSESPEEKELMLFHFNNSIVPSGNIEKDMKRCQLLANENRITKEVSEAKRALLSKDKTGTGSGAGQKPPITPEKPVMTDNDRKVLAKTKNVKWDPKLKLHVRWDKTQQKWFGPAGEIGTLPPLKP